MTCIAKFFYDSDEVTIYLSHYKISVKTLIAMGFMQRILGFNRRVPWPVHFTSLVTGYNKVVRPKGHATPGWMPNCYIQAINGIIMGSNIYIGPGVKIISANHDILHLEAHKVSPPIIIEDNCWIGANSVILPGVHLGPHTIVGAGSVVTKSFGEGHCVIAGNPAKKIKDISDKIQLALQY